MQGLTEQHRRAVSPRTKMIVLNSPHNPVGKVFTRAELERVAALAEKHNLLVMSDEVVRAPLPLPAPQSLHPNL